jgi:hypothetical protein
MRHTLTALLSAASVCALAGVAPAAAQVFYGAPGPYAAPAPGAYTHYPEGGLVKGQSVVPPQISYSLPPSEEVAQPGVVGSCSLIAGNRVCTDTPAHGYGYGYGYAAPGGLFGGLIGAPFAAAGTLAAAPFEAAGAVVGAPYAPAPAPYGVAPMGPYPAYAAAYPVRRPIKGKSIVPSSTAYSLPPSAETARPGVVGSCSIIAGNRVCTGAPAIP